jgi:protein-disulfide isomerase/uncharacterized membrane protein
MAIKTPPSSTHNGLSPNAHSGTSRGKFQWSTARYLVLFSLILGTVFAVLSLYTHVHVRMFQASEQGALCDISETFNCSRIELSSWSEIGGIPLASFGFAFGGVLLFLYFYMAAELWFDLTLVAGLLATILSVILFCVAKFVIGSICLWCLGSYAAHFLFFVSNAVSEKSRSFSTRLLNGVKVLMSGFTVTAFPHFCATVIVGLLFLGGSLPLMSTVVSQLSLADRQAKIAQIAKEGTLDSLRTKVGIKIPLIAKEDSPLTDFIDGPTNAPVQITEFADFQCPTCQVSYRLFRKLVKEYSPHIGFVIKNYPLDQACNSTVDRAFHVYACEAAELARCAGEKGKYFELADLFTQPNFIPQQGPKSLLSLISSQKKIFKSFDIVALEECKKSGRQLDKVKADVQLGNDFNVTATPTVFLNGYRLDGHDEATIRSYIKAFLAEKGIDLSAK